jgi:hypothetical protein
MIVAMSRFRLAADMSSQNITTPTLEPFTINLRICKISPG